jgi:serine/threonine protein kinase
MRARAHTHTHTHTLALVRLLAHTHARTHTHSLTCSCTHARTLAHTHLLTHSRSLARSHTQEIDLAVKEVNFDLISASFEEVQREILLLRSLRHENIIEYYTSFSHTVEDEEGNEVLLIWLVMQLMEYGAS